eukprot:CFRG4296T1
MDVANTHAPMIYENTLSPQSTNKRVGTPTYPPRTPPRSRHHVHSTSGRTDHTHNNKLLHCTLSERLAAYEASVQQSQSPVRPVAFKHIRVPGSVRSSINTITSNTKPYPDSHSSRHTRMNVNTPANIPPRSCNTVGKKSGSFSPKCEEDRNRQKIAIDVNDNESNCDLYEHDERENDKRKVILSPRSRRNFDEQIMSKVLVPRSRSVQPSVVIASSPQGKNDTPDRRLIRPTISPMASPPLNRNRATHASKQSPIPSPSSTHKTAYAHTHTYTHNTQPNKAIFTCINTRNHQLEKATDLDAHLTPPTPKGSSALTPRREKRIPPPIPPKRSKPLISQGEFLKSTTIQEFIIIPTDQIPTSQHISHPTHVLLSEQTHAHSLATVPTQPVTPTPAHSCTENITGGTTTQAATSAVTSTQLTLHKYATSADAAPTNTQARICTNTLTSCKDHGDWCSNCHDRDALHHSGTSNDEVEKKDIRKCIHTHINTKFENAHSIHTQQNGNSTVSSQEVDTKKVSPNFENTRDISQTVIASKNRTVSNIPMNNFSAIAPVLCYSSVDTNSRKHGNVEKPKTIACEISGTRTFREDGGVPVGICVGDDRVGTGNWKQLEVSVCARKPPPPPPPTESSRLRNEQFKSDVPGRCVNNVIGDTIPYATMHTDTRALTQPYTHASVNITEKEPKLKSAGIGGIWDGVDGRRCWRKENTNKDMLVRTLDSSRAANNNGSTEHGVSYILRDFETIQSSQSEHSVRAPSESQQYPHTPTRTATHTDSHDPPCKGMPTVTTTVIRTQTTLPCPAFSLPQEVRTFDEKQRAVTHIDNITDSRFHALPGSLPPCNPITHTHLNANVVKYSDYLSENNTRSTTGNYIESRRLHPLLNTDKESVDITLDRSVNTACSNKVPSVCEVETDKPRQRTLLHTESCFNDETTSATHRYSYQSHETSNASNTTSAPATIKSEGNMFKRFQELHQKEKESIISSPLEPAPTKLCVKPVKKTSKLSSLISFFNSPSTVREQRKRYGAQSNQQRNIGFSTQSKEISISVSPRSLGPSPQTTEEAVKKVLEKVLPSRVNELFADLSSLDNKVGVLLHKLKSTQKLKDKRDAYLRQVSIQHELRRCLDGIAVVAQRKDDMLRWVALKKPYEAKGLGDEPDDIAADHVDPEVVVKIKLNLASYLCKRWSLASLSLRNVPKVIDEWDDFGWINDPTQVFYDQGPKEIEIEPGLVLQAMTRAPSVSKERHKDLMHLEKEIAAIRYLFSTLASLIVEQEGLADIVATNVARTYNNTRNVGAVIGHAKELHCKNQKRKLIIAGAGTVLGIQVLAGLGRSIMSIASPMFFFL